MKDGGYLWEAEEWEVGGKRDLQSSEHILELKLSFMCTGYSSCFPLSLLYYIHLACIKFFIMK